MKKKITISPRMLISMILILIMVVVLITYLIISHFDDGTATAEDPNPNTEKVYQKSNKVVIPNVQPKRK